MSRHKIGANQAIFFLLDEYCAARGIHLQNRASPRWIASEHKDRDFIVTSLLKDVIRFGSTRFIARILYADRTLFFCIGFQEHPLPNGAVELEMNGGYLTVLLAELKPRPTASALAVRNVVEATDRDADSGYAGHDFGLVSALFPPIQVFEFADTTPATWNLAFNICVDECELGGSWIEGRLPNVLRSIAELDGERIPYSVLCRSIFDGDPTSFFLALYRCLEALYSYGSARAVGNRLGLTQQWREIAVVLEDVLSWYPREEQSLIQLVQMAARPDLLALLLGFGEKFDPGIDDVALAQLTAKKMYWVRNSIVHYRPAQQSISLEHLDWISICCAMAGIVLHVYDAV